MEGRREERRGGKKTTNGKGKENARGKETGKNRKGNTSHTVIGQKK